MDLRLTPRTPRIPCPGCRPEILRRVQGFKKSTKPYARKQSIPCLALLFTSGKNSPCVAWEQGHSEPWTPGSTAPQHRAAQGRSGVEAGQPQGSERRYPKRPQKSIQWSHGQGPARPSPSRVGIVLCSLLYTFSRTKAHPATTLGAPLCWREGLPPPRPRRRYYPARRMMRGEEGPEVFHLKTKKNLAFRYANPIQTPHRR